MPTTNDYIDTGQTLSDRDAVFAMITKGYASKVQDCICAMPHCIVCCIPSELREAIEYLAGAEEKSQH